jgi:hypothetical protein
MVDAARLAPAARVRGNAAMSDAPIRNRRWFQFSLRTLFVAVMLFYASAAIFTAYHAVRYEYAGPWLYFRAFGLLGASCGTFFGRPGLGIALGLVASVAVFFVFSDLLFNPDALPL